MVMSSQPYKLQSFHHPQSLNDDRHRVKQMFWSINFPLNPEPNSLLGVKESTAAQLLSQLGPEQGWSLRRADHVYLMLCK